MKPIVPSPNKHQWPRHAVASVECRKRDLVVRIADWTRDLHEPGFDVEVYIAGVYDWNESETFTTKNNTPPRSNDEARKAAILFAAQQIAKLLSAERPAPRASTRRKGAL